jgi:uncharacterized membrane protein YdjX (TVP38/TMEM64 family)
MTGRRQPDQAGKKCPRWWPWAAGGFLLLVLCLGWFLLPLREWIEALQSWLLGLGLTGVLIFVLMLIVVTFLPCTGLAVAHRKPATSMVSEHFR